MLNLSQQEHLGTIAGSLVDATILCGMRETYVVENLIDTTSRPPVQDYRCCEHQRAWDTPRL